jgi:hypothetical protein
MKNSKLLYLPLLAASVMSAVAASSPLPEETELQLEVTIRGLFADEVTDSNTDEVYVILSHGRGQWYQEVGRLKLDYAVGAGWNRDINKVVFRGIALHPNSNQLNLTFMEDDPNLISGDDHLGEISIAVTNDGQLLFERGSRIQPNGHFRGYRRSDLRGSGARYAIFYNARLIR